MYTLKVKNKKQPLIHQKAIYVLKKVHIENFNRMICYQTAKLNYKTWVKCLIWAFQEVGATTQNIKIFRKDRNDIITSSCFCGLEDYLSYCGKSLNYIEIYRVTLSFDYKGTKIALDLSSSRQTTVVKSEDYQKISITDFDKIIERAIALQNVPAIDIE